jgi:hypothetical protein
MKKTIARPAPIRNPESVYIGTSATGVEWRAWRDDGETADDFAAKVQTMAEAFRALAAKGAHRAA